FGNGFSSTFSFEEPRVLGAAPANNGVVNMNLGNPVLATNTTDQDKAKIRFPDIVTNWRVDQAWGSAQIMGAAHDVSGAYYAATTAVAAGSACATATSGIFGGTAAGTLTGSETCGHPADKVGWAAGIGAKFNAYGGDYFQFQVNYTQGAARYAANTPAGNL